MKNALITCIALIGAMLTGYFAHFYITPNVEVANASNHNVSSFVVTLPGSRLDFGGLEPGGRNTIYYSIAQTDGYYSMTVVTEDGTELRNICGTVKDNEIHKRVRITLTETKDLTCEGT